MNRTTTKPHKPNKLETRNLHAPHFPRLHQQMSTQEEKTAEDNKPADTVFILYCRQLYKTTNIRSLGGIPCGSGFPAANVLG